MQNQTRLADLPRPSMKFWNTHKQSAKKKDKRTGLIPARKKIEKKSVDEKKNERSLYATAAWFKRTGQKDKRTDRYPSSPLTWAFPSLKKKKIKAKKKKKRSVQIWAQFTVSALKGSGLPSLLHLKTEDQVPHQCIEAKVRRHCNTW